MSRRAALLPRLLLLALLLAVGGMARASDGAGRGDLREQWAGLGAHTPGSDRRVDHTEFARLLAAYREVPADGIARLHYAAMDDTAAARLDGYLRYLSEVELELLDRDEQLAFWLNLFNATVVELILTHYPVASMRDIDLDPRAAVHGPWTAARAAAGGVRLSLAAIEDEILWPIWRDPRLHYALYRGSLGCPNLPPRPFGGATIDAELDAAAWAYVNHPRGAAVLNGGLVVSSLYRWNIADFGGTERDVVRHLMAFAEPAKAMRLQRFDAIDADRYDWRLNDH